MRHRTIVDSLCPVKYWKAILEVCALWCGSCSQFGPLTLFNNI